MACGDKLSMCYDPEVRNISVPPPALLFRYIDDETLDKLCNHYGNIKGCIDETIDDCTPQQRVILSYQTETLEYLCTTGYEDYKIVRPCYENEELLSRVEQCNATFTANMAQMSTIDEPMTTKREYLCSHMTDLVTCVRDSTQEICSEKAAEWIYNIKTIMLKSTLSEIGCPKKDQLPTILAVSFAVFVAFIIILLAFIFIYRKIKNEEEMTKLNKDKSLCKTSMKSTSMRKSTEEVVIHSCKRDKQLQQQQQVQKMTGGTGHTGKDEVVENGELMLTKETEQRRLESDSKESTGVTVALLEDSERVAEDVV